MRALVSGYYGFRNAGDEAILAGLVEGFRREAPEVELTVLSADPEATRAEHGVAAIPRHFAAARAALQQTDLFISGGGGLLQDATSWRSPLYYLNLLRLARRAGVPVACLGQSVGPVTRFWVRSLVRRALSRVAVLAVRDQRSAEALRELGVRREVHVTGDLALLLQAPVEAECVRAWHEAGLAEKQGPTAAIAVRRLPHDDRGCGQRIAEAAVGACRAVHLRPVFLPMQNPQDVDLAEAAAAAVGGAEVMRASLTARQVLALLGGFDLVIAMRLHALILAALCGLPLVAISYDPKVDGLVEELGLPPTVTAQASEAKELTAAVDHAWHTRAQLSHLATRVAHLRADAQANIRLALQVLTR